MGIFRNANGCGASKDERSKSLHECPVCKSELVYQLERHQVSDTEWKVTLLCPNCFTLRTPVVDREVVRELLKKTRVRREQIMEDLDNVEKRHMEEAAKSFIDAINKDHILPEDFILPTGTDTNAEWAKHFERTGKMPPS